MAEKQDTKKTKPSEAPMDKAEKLRTLLREQLNTSVDPQTAERLLKMAKENNVGGYVQWMSSDGQAYFPASITVKRLPCGVYAVNQDMMRGLFFSKIPVSTEGLIRLHDTNGDKVIAEIQKFWDSEEKFRANNLAYKRGILLHGPPGSGKTSVIRMISKDVVDRGGIVVQFGDPDCVAAGLRVLREVQPDTPLVVMMEDLDSIISNYVESSVINLLDGVTMIDKVVFVATTNYPEKMGERVVNRPSRFDRRFYIGPPNEKSRRMYFKFLFAGPDADPKNLAMGVLDQWVADTEGMSIAHLKELFVAVTIIGTPYNEAIKILRSMDVLPNSDSYKGDQNEVPDSGPPHKLAPALSNVDVVENVGAQGL